MGGEHCDLSGVDLDERITTTLDDVDGDRVVVLFVQAGYELRRSLGLSEGFAGLCREQRVKRVPFLDVGQRLLVGLFAVALGA